jgi:hypothetical protein
MSHEQKGFKTMLKAPDFQLIAHSFSDSIIFSLKKLAGLDGFTFPGKFVVVFKSCEISEKVRLR